ncbi:hypothetical protein ACWY4P_04690 [Streptomyces sp. LZ34]
MLRRQGTAGQKDFFFLRARGRVPYAYDGSTLREGLQGVGRARVPADHPAARHRERAARERAGAAGPG